MPTNLLKESHLSILSLVKSEILTLHNMNCLQSKKLTNSSHIGGNKLKTKKMPETALRLNLYNLDKDNFSFFDEAYGKISFTKY